VFVRAQKKKHMTAEVLNFGIAWAYTRAEARFGEARLGREVGRMLEW
jgi:hypothetical protein